MESQISLGSYIIFGVIVLILWVFGSAIVAAIYTFGVNLFSPKMKVVNGKVIRIKKRESFARINDSADEEQLIDVSEYSIFFEEEQSHQKYFVPITQEAFDDLKEKEISSLKNISLSFKEWLWERSFDHVEIA